MSKQRKVAELNSRILKVASQVSRAIEAETEEILEDAENVVKQFVPARHVKRTLAAIEQKLDREGIEAEFEKGISREALRRTAGEEVAQDEVDDLVDKIVKAIVDELEGVLGDADDVMDDEVKGVANEGFDGDNTEIEAKMKSIVEHKLAALGIHSRFARVAKSKRLSLAEKIANAVNEPVKKSN